MTRAKVEQKSSESVNQKNFFSQLAGLGPVLALVVLVIITTMMNSSFLDVNNLLNLLRQVSINGLIAFGMTFVILTGGIDLSVGAMLALTSALTAMMITSGVPTLLAMLIGILIGGVLGGINGLIITKGGAAPFIASLATMTIFRGATYVFTDGNPITGKVMNDSFAFQFIGRGYFFGIPVPVIIMIVAFIILYILLHKMTFGRKTYALGGNEKAAFVSGIKVKMTKTWIYVISGIMSSAAGMVLISRLSSAQPDAGTGFEMDAIAAVVLGGTSLAGGRGRIFGTFIGALIIGTLNNGMNLIGISSFYQQIVKGIVIIIAVLLDRRKSA
ncbi:ABC transporter permease [Leuconostoc carnosum]|uniref:ABC transporter permease n=1 Tax=Leuconostoc carnosum TaxID=1252 RepID=UPI00345D6ECA